MGATIPLIILQATIMDLLTADLPDAMVAIELQLVSLLGTRQGVTVVIRLD